MIYITDFHKGVFMVHVVNFMFMFNTFCKKQVFVTWNICNTGALYKAVLVVANCCSVHIVRLNCCRLIMYWPRIASCCTTLCLCMFCHFLGSCVFLSLKALAECACVFYDFAWCVVVYIYLSFNKVFYYLRLVSFVQTFIGFVPLTLKRVCCWTNFEILFVIFFCKVKRNWRVSKHGIQKYTRIYSLEPNCCLYNVTWYFCIKTYLKINTENKQPRHKIT